MKTPARPKQTDTVNRAKLARMMSVSLPTVDDWQRRGCPVVATGGKGRSYSFNVQDVIEWRVKDERRRQGMPPASETDNPKVDKFVTGYNPFRQISYNSVLSFVRLLFCQPMLDDMVADTRKWGGCNERTAKKVVASICYQQWMTWAHWVREDWFNRACDENLDDLASRIGARGKFIRGPIPDEKVSNGEHLPDAVHDLLSEVFANQQPAAASAEDEIPTR